MSRPFYYRVTHGIRVTVRPSYLPERSQPLGRQFVFAYHVRIENVGSEPARLVGRRWWIHDSIGEDSLVEGDGVVGQQPWLEPGAVHQYQSFCVLKSPAGHMEGEYLFHRRDGTPFAAGIPRFLLAADEPAEPLR